MSKDRDCLVEFRFPDFVDLLASRCLAFSLHVSSITTPSRFQKQALVHANSSVTLLISHFAWLYYTRSIHSLVVCTFCLSPRLTRITFT